MFAGFNLTLTDDIIQGSRMIDTYYPRGLQIYSSQKSAIHNSLDTYLNPDGSLSASQIESDWFKSINVDVFLSHSHMDEKAVIGLAGYLYTNYRIKCFIDSCIWGYANDLLKAIDNKYSINDSRSYDYNKCIFSSSHVHLILNGALAKMINNTECLIFVNTPNSIKSQDVKDKSKTASPWIYSELLMATEFPHQKLQYYRPLMHSDQHLFEASKLQVEYDVKVDKLSRLYLDDLTAARQTVGKSDPLAILDQVYLAKGLVKHKGDRR